MTAETGERFPWAAMMAFGFGHLRLASREFWAMTPRELAAAAEGLAGSGGEPPRRADLDALMARFPDKEG